MLLFILPSVYASAQLENELPIAGRWKIISYRISSANDKTSATNWVNKIIEFTHSKAVLLYGGNTYQLCPQFDYQVTTENAQQFFSSHYQIEPNHLGVIQTEIQVVNIVCQAPNWPADKSVFIKVTDQQMLSHWNGIMFYFTKQNDLTDPTPIVQTTNPEALLVTPQSVGLINPESHFDQQVLTENLPDYTITAETQTNEKGQTLIADFKLSREDQLLLKVYPDPQTDKIKSISLFDPQTQVPNHAKLGMTYADLFKDYEAFIDCQAGTTPARSNQTVCVFKNLPTIQYVFESKTSNEDSLLSPIEELNHAQLIEWIWLADRQLVHSPTEQKLVESTNTSDSETDATAVVVPIDAKSAYDIQNQLLQEVNHQLREAIQKQFSLPPDHSNSVDQPQPLIYFTQSQQIWEQYRDDNCRWYSSLEVDETQQNLTKFTCLEQMTRERVAEIERVLKNY
jgi:uncharacterized protein YecT (DUF1311 family)